MYQPSHFAQADEAALLELMRGFPLATLVSVQAGALTADPVPLHWNETRRALEGHVARANPLWREAAGAAVLAVFRGEQAYVSPSWYPSKAEHHKVVPTWNYAVVNAHGVLEVVDDPAWVHGLVSRLTDAHESPRAAPWAVDDAPAAYVQQMLRAIVGIRIPVTRLEGKWKLSQNRSTPDRQGVGAGLRREAGAAGEAMARRMEDTSPPADDRSAP